MRDSENLSHRRSNRHNYVRHFDVTMRRKNGTLLLAAESSFATRDATGKIERYQGFVLDVTEKRRAEDEMRRRNRELNALNAMAVVATQSFDLDEILNLTLRQVVSLFGARVVPFIFPILMPDLPPSSRVGSAQPRQITACRNQFCGWFWRSSHALARRSDYGGIPAASYRGGCGLYPLQQ